MILGGSVETLPPFTSLSKRMKKIISILVLSIIILTVMVSPCLAIQVVFDYHDDGEETPPGGAQHAGIVYQTFQAQSSYISDSVSMYLKKDDDNGATTWQYELYTWDGNDLDGTKELVASSNTFTYEEVSSGGGWVKEDWTDVYQVTATSYYCLRLKLLTGTSTLHVWRAQDDVLPYGESYPYGTQYVTWTSPTDYYDLNFRMYGSYTIDPEVVTLDATYEGDNAVEIGGMVTSLGANYTRTAGWIEYGTDTSYGTDIFVGYVNDVGRDGAYYHLLRLVPPGTTFHYRAYMVMNDSNAYYGSDKTFYIATANSTPIISFELIENAMDGQKYETTLESMGTATSVDIVIQYSTTLAGLLGSPSEITVTTGATTEGIWKTEDDSLTSGTVYYMRAEADGGSGKIGYSDIQTIKAYDNDKPKAVNWLESWFTNIFGGGAEGDYGNIVWWIIAILISGIGFFISWRVRSAIPGIIISLLMIGFLLVVDAINAWLVTLMAMIAGFLFILVWRKKAA